MVGLDAWEEEGEYEYVSDHGGKEGRDEQHIEPAVLYQPLDEAGIEGSEHAPSEHGGRTHDVSGDGCGDGAIAAGTGSSAPKKATDTANPSAAVRGNH
jgi:hypothetical protein